MDDVNLFIHPSGRSEGYGDLGFINRRPLDVDHGVVPVSHKSRVATFTGNNPDLRDAGDIGYEGYMLPVRRERRMS